MKNEGNYGVWLKHALSNLEIARQGQFSKNVLYSDLCFECQQSVEKSLKGLLVFHNKEFPKTHSIQKLLNLLSEEYSINEILRKTTLLSDYAVETRYPGDIEELPDENNFKEALELAEYAYRWVVEQVGML